jgi:hypothetical protein
MRKCSSVVQENNTPRNDGNPPFSELARLLQCCWHTANAAARNTVFEEVPMFNTEIGRKFAAIVCTVLFSATCVAGAVGPATAHQTSVTTARQVA